MNEQETVLIEEVSDVPVKPERPEPFVYPTTFITERGETIDLPWPGGLIEIKVAKTVAEILKLAPQLRGLFQNLESATDVGANTEESAVKLLSEAGDVLAVAVGAVPELVLALMCILTGLDTETAGANLSIMGDGARLIGVFFAKEMSRLGTSGFNLNNDVGFSVPTLADVASIAADRGLTGEAPDRR